MYIVTRIDTQSAKDNNRRNTKVGRTAPLSHYECRFSIVNKVEATKKKKCTKENWLIDPQSIRPTAGELDQ